jgi:ribonuclease BN (tRNA processing enzyme)
MFLGSGNAFAPEGRAFSSFLLDGRYLFDCGPTVLQQLHKARLSSHDIDAVLVSHFHGDHFLGVPFLFLDAWHTGRTRDLNVVGPPGVEERAEQLLEIAFPHLGRRMPFRRVYTEVSDGLEAEVAGLAFTTAEVEHVPDLRCFAFRAHLNGRSLVFSGDTQLCEGLLRLVPGADVLVLECSCAGEPVHLSPEGIAEIRRHASPHTQTIVTHLDAHEHPDGFRGLHVASDLSRFSF